MKVVSNNSYAFVIFFRMNTTLLCTFQCSIDKISDWIKDNCIFPSVWSEIPFFSHSLFLLLSFFLFSYEFEWESLNLIIVWLRTRQKWLRDSTRLWDFSRDFAKIRTKLNSTNYFIFVEFVIYTYVRSLSRWWKEKSIVHTTPLSLSILGSLVDKSVMRESIKITTFLVVFKTLEQFWRMIVVVGPIDKKGDTPECK